MEHHWLEGRITTQTSKPEKTFCDVKEKSASELMMFDSDSRQAWQ